ncbi:carboxypeptidase-like regulatory domain-containing protein [uncultured Christiangramia sp.]|uniref:carboxypeptidase-like regulatory domain-containing protein n=1 Tax=uncultured Christiangramia sp. TaxID=503836 RepID=UPI0025F50829|nr:carboxypeptidase-like regulatory domain-containing protein [uncultured Christiangramia sp.]
MMRYYMFIAFLIIAISSNAQNEMIDGVMADSVTKEPLSFVNIYVLNTSQGTTSNENGYFQLKEPNAGQNLRFGYVGYDSKDITYVKKQLDTIFLSRNKEQLNEVVVQAPLQDKTIKIKASKSKDRLGISNSGDDEGARMFLRYFAKPLELKDEAAYLKSAEIFLFKGIGSVKRDYIFRIRIMSLTEDAEPGYDLIDNITLTGRPGSKVRIDLEDERILIPGNGFLIGVEGLQINQNYIRTTKLLLENGKYKDFKKYGPTFKAVESKDPVYYLSRGEWKKMKMPVPAMNLIITN